MRFLIVAIVLLISLNAFNQYYYNDLVALKMSTRQYSLLKDNNVKSVKAVSYESNDQLTEDFRLEQQINQGAKIITTYSNHPSSGEVVTNNFYDNGRLIKTVDSSGNVKTTTTYQYDAEGKVDNILTQTNDAFMNSTSSELHKWNYNDDKPTYMLRVKDNRDTTLIELSYDEEGNVAQENWKRKDKTVQSYFYYYNDTHQLTDIVRYNTKAQKMLPDFLFEYDSNGNLTQMTQVPSGSSDYTVWQYVYDDKGLKQKEVAYNKQKQLLGRVEYRYQ
jgi:YD repeat-containing protein